MYHYYSLVMTSIGEWVVVDTLDTRGLNNEDYKSRYQRLKAEKRKWLEEYEMDIQALTKNLFDIKDEKEKDVQYFQQQIEQKERELQEKERVEAEKELELQRYVHQLQEKERQKAESK